MNKERSKFFSHLHNDSNSMRQDCPGFSMKGNGPLSHPLLTLQKGNITRHTEQDSTTMVEQSRLGTRDNASS